MKCWRISVRLAWSGRPSDGYDRLNYFVIEDTVGWLAHGAIGDDAAAAGVNEQLAGAGQRGDERFRGAALWPATFARQFGHANGKSTESRIQISR
jgi:hypothetical protein